MHECCCGQRFHVPEVFPVHCHCGAVYADEASLRDLRWVDPTPDKSPAIAAACIYRGELLTAGGEDWGCGCSGVDVRRCELHGEVITLRPVNELGRKTLQAEYRGYRGRNCRTCTQQVASPSSVPIRQANPSPLAREMYERSVIRETRFRETKPGFCETPFNGRGVTLAAIDCVNPQLAAFALDLSRRGCPWEKVVLFSHVCPEILPAGITWREIPRLTFEGYQRFCLRELAAYVVTPHVLTIQTDGWLLRPELFNAKWLDFDYIGAPWREAYFTGRSRVGNSGCCLRSFRLLAATRELATESAMASRSGFRVLLDDLLTCCTRS
jgi:hypothetical protein